MSRCLSPDEIIDAVDGALPAGRRTHLAGCATCGDAVADARAALALAAGGDVPEPPAAFWPSINQRVHAAIAVAEAAPGWRAWLRWDVVVPVAGLALLVLSLASAVDRAVGRDAGSADDAAAARLAVEPLPAESLLDDDALALVEALAASLPEGGWEALGLTRLPELDDAAAVLSADERAALTALLQSAVDRPKS
jgi:hypothetical protein